MGSLAYATEHILINNVFFLGGANFCIVTTNKIGILFSIYCKFPQKMLNFWEKTHQIFETTKLKKKKKKKN
jgi:hypothetical protein